MGELQPEDPLPLEAALNISCPNSMAPPLLKVNLNVPCPSQPPRRELELKETINLLSIRQDSKTV